MSNENAEKDTAVENNEKITDNNEVNKEIKKKGFFSRMSTLKKVIFVIVVVVLLAVAAAGITFIVIREKGKASLHNMSNTLIDPMALEESKQIFYDGKEYKYNDNLINILLIGTDCPTTVAQRREANLDCGAGFADTLFLVTIDPDKKTVDCISVSRYTMTNVDMLLAGFINATVEKQVSYQFGLGAGLEDSSSYTVKAVSGIFGNIPIHGYATLSLEAIRPLNNVVGGVEVEVLEDIPDHGVNEITTFGWGIGDGLTNVKGKTITLTDAEAYAYLRHRGDQVGDADKRFDRQRQYLKALIKKILDKTKTDFTFPMKVRDALSEWLVTDISDDELMYLVSSLAFYNLNMDSITHLPGTTKLGEDQVEEFYLDDDAMKKLIVEKFYKPVN